MEQLTVQERNKMAAKYGGILAIYYVIITTLCFAMVSHLMGYYLLKLLGFVGYMLLLGFFAAKIRTANGGFIEFKQVYGAIIVMVLVAATAFYIYNFVYVQYIDKSFGEKMKTAVISFMEHWKVPDESLNSTSAAMDKAMAESKTFNLGNNLLSYAGNLIYDCLFGLIVAAIVKKNKPLF